jgi:hypothetical protein
MVFTFVQIFLKQSDTIHLANYLKINKKKCTTPKATGILGNSGHLRIYISAKSVPLVRDLVLKHMVTSMHYKLGLYI